MPVKKVHVSMKITETEMQALQELASLWRCNQSEVLRLLMHNALESARKNDLKPLAKSQPENLFQ